MDRRDSLAQLLTDDDVETLKHLARDGTGENTCGRSRRISPNLPTWADAATGQPLLWPATEALALKFVAHHLWDPVKRAGDPRHGMPANVAESCERRGCRAAVALCPKHRQAAPGELEQTAPLERDRGTVRAPSLRSALRLAIRASSRPRERKSEPAVARDVLDWLIATCATDRLADTRDLAILLLAFASGRRRRSEVARLRVEQLRDEPPAWLDPRDAKSHGLPCLAIHSAGPRRATPTRRAGCFWSALRSTRCANGSSGPTSRRGRSSRRSDRQAALRHGGLEPEAFSAHGLRAGYLTEAARQGIALPGAMQQSQHRSVQQAESYYNEAERVQGRAARLGL